MKSTPEEKAPQALLTLVDEAKAAGLMAPEVSPEKMRQFLEVQLAYEANEARKAYNAAISEFQRRCPIVDKLDDADGKKYAALDRIWSTIKPLMTELGLSITWQICEIRDAGVLCHLEGRLAHKDGHGQDLRFDMPVPEAIIRKSDGKAIQNRAQVFGSAISYTKRYATCAVLGVVTGKDYDAGTTAEFIDDEESKEIETLLEACRGLRDFNEAKFWEWVSHRNGSNTTKASQITVDGLADVLDQLNRKLGRRK